MGVRAERLLMGGKGSGRKPGEIRVPRVRVECLFCYIEMQVTEGAIDGGAGKFCSTAHYREWRQGRSNREKPQIRRVTA